jgi:hypothetical protein
MQTFHFFKNTGGINEQANELSLASGEAEEIINLHATAEGSWSNRNIGYINLTAAPLASGGPVTSLYQYQPLTGKPYFIAAAGEELFTVDPGSGAATTIASGLSDGAKMQFITFNGLLIGCNGIDPPKKWDGQNAVANLGGWPPSIAGVTIGKPAISEIYANRVVFSGDSLNPSMLFISEQENPENFTPDASVTSAGALQVSPGDGEKITALKTLFLPLSNEEVLIIFKERSTYILSGSDSESFSLQKISNEFGAVNHDSVIQVGSEMMFLSSEGITTLSTATLQGNLITGFLSDRIRAQISRLNRAALSRSFAIHLRDRKEVWWFVPEGSTMQNKLVLVYNYHNQGAWSRRTGIVAASGALVNGKLFTGNYDGNIQQQLHGNSYAGNPISWVYRTGFQEFSSPRVRKRIRDIELFLKQLSNVTFTVNMSWDFNRSSTYRQSRNFIVQQDAASCIYGSARFGLDHYSEIGTSSVRFTPSGSGRYFQLELQGQAINAPVEIEGWTITTIQGGLR